MADLHDPAIMTAVAAAIEGSVKRALELAPAATRELAEMEGTVLAIECTSPAVEVFITVLPAGQLHISNYTEAQVSTRVRGDIDGFIALATAEDPAATLINSNLEIIGNTGPLLALQQIITGMDLDWEAPLVATLGDVAGHQLAQLLRGVFRWGQGAASSLRRQLSEFILEEARLSPPAAELEAFYRDLERLTLKVDRLESRCRRLALRVDEQSQ